MPVPASINDLSTTAASNSPTGGENPFPDLDNHIRALASFIAVLRDGKLDASTVSAFMLTVLNDADAATARTTLGAVGLTGNETVAGTKTFSSSPIVPTPTTGDNTTKAASTAFAKTTADASAAAVEAKVIGIGQTRQDVKASRAAATTYTNATDKPIEVSVSCQPSGFGLTLRLTVNGVPHWSTTCGSGEVANVSGIVPPGGTYSVTDFFGTSTVGTILAWIELR